MPDTTANQLENSRTQMRKGIVEYCALLVIARERVYATEILRELKEADLLVVEGTLYPLLNRLRGAGLLEHEWVESESGPPRKYYSITSHGRAVLNDLSKTWQTLSASIDSLSRRCENRRLLS